MGIQEFIAKLEGIFRVLNEVESEEWVKEVRRYEPHELDEIWRWIRRNYSSNALPKPGICYRAALELGFVEARQIRTIDVISCPKCYKGWIQKNRIREGYGVYSELVPCDCSTGQIRARIKPPQQEVA